MSTVTLTLDETSVATLTQTLMREAENREQECNNLSYLLEQVVAENTKLRTGEWFDEAHDHMEELVAENKLLSNLLAEVEVEHKAEIDYFIDRVANLEIENDALIDWNEEAAERLDVLTGEVVLLEHELEMSASYIDAFQTPYSIPSEAYMEDIYESDYSDYPSIYEMDEMSPEQTVKSITA